MILRLISTSLKFGANFGKGTDPGKCLAFFIIARLGVLHSFLRESCIDVDKTIQKSCRFRVHIEQRHLFGVGAKLLNLLILREVLRVNRNTKPQAFICLVCQLQPLALQKEQTTNFKINYNSVMVAQLWRNVPLKSISVSFIKSSNRPTLKLQHTFKYKICHFKIYTCTLYV